VNFYRTVVLIIHHDEQGAFGLVLNRPTDNTVCAVWEDVDDSVDDCIQPINSGGPVDGPLLAIHTDELCSENEIVPGIHFAAHRDHLDVLVHEAEHQFRIFSGYSGWAPGQLEGELELGGWMVMPARRDVIFSDPDAMWRTAAQEIGEHVTVDLLRSSTVPEDPSSN
jgi:putative transcriptional regulator